MTALFIVMLVVHGLIHLLGFAKAFGLAELRQLTQPISPVLGVVWFFAGFLFVSAAAAFYLWPRGWWALAACAVVLSMLVIVSDWDDARFGAIANAIVLTGVLFGFLAHGPFSLRGRYEDAVSQALAASVPDQTVTDADLAHLPAPVQRYLRSSGVVGQPRVHNFRARMHGRIRSSSQSRWMPITAEQYNFVDEPARHFYLNASMFTVPVQGYHRYVGSSATMEIKAAALVPVVDVSGPEMDQSETVTMFNDFCFLAPAVLIDPAIQWDCMDDRTARAAFTNASHIIRAELSFNDAGELTDFWSDDRYQNSADGRSSNKLRWSTPLRGYRPFGNIRLASRGEARWHEPGGEYAYIELTIDEVRYNVRSR